jgi:hypothetical protein
MIKAIDTVYNGYKFRSRLEARWAVFFDALRIKWEYEKEGYELGELGRYLPDFYIPVRPYGPWFVEIKGNMADERGLAKARYLDDNPPKDENGYPVAMGVLIRSELEYAEITPGGDDYPEQRNSMASFVEMICSRGLHVDEINEAVRAARSARFEFNRQ